MDCFSHGSNLLSVQGAVPWVDNCHLRLYTTVGFEIHHSTSLRCRDAPIPRRLVDSTRIQDHWFPGQGQPPAGMCAELVLPVIAESRLCFYPMT